ncbi:PilN domain-containing protein [Myxococcota bacterium]|nr:PilN domain-containing protein [Myxococcota bacterium]
MLEINLLPIREARRRAGLRKQAVQLSVGLALTVACIGTVHFHITRDIAESRARIAQMQSDIDRLKPQIEQVAVFRKKKAALTEKIRVIDGLVEARTGPVKLLGELASRTPERLWLTELQSQGTAITMEGLSLDNDLVADFLTQLQESSYFTAVDLNRTKLGNAVDGLKLVEFSIRANVANQPDESAAEAG